MKNYPLSVLAWILAPFVFSFAFGLDIYIPVVPQMIEVFETDASYVQLTLSLFLFTTGAGQLVIGPFADRFGRKRAFYLSTLLYTLGALGCAYSFSITELIISRVICAFGASGMLSTSFALVRDLYSEDKSAKMYAYLNGAIGISPTLAPIIGGYLALFFGWRSIFLFLVAIGLFSLLVTYKYIEETLSKEYKAPFSFQNYKKLLNPYFLKFCLIAGCAEAILFSFFSVSPFLIIDQLKVQPHLFGYYFAVFGLVIGLGGLASGLVIDKIGLSRGMQLGWVLMLFGGSLMVLAHLVSGLSLTGFLIPMAIACSGSILLLSGSVSYALEPYPEMAGTASAGLGFMQHAISALVGTILMLFPTVSTLPYSGCILIMGLIISIIFNLRFKEKLAI